MKRALPVLAALLAVLAAPSSSLLAQEVIVEEQLPLDSAGTLYEIDPELRRGLGLFEEVDGFTSARLLREEGGRAVLEISYREDGRLLRERRFVEPDVLESLRGLLSEGIARDRSREDAAVAARRDRSGRSRLVLGQTALGLGYYGWAVPAILDLSGGRAIVSAYLLTAGTSFLAPYLLTRDRPVTSAHGRLSWWGGTRGILYGLLGASVVSGDDDHGDDGHLATALGTSIVGTWLGYETVGWAGLDEGGSVLWSTAGDLGTLAGLASAYTAGFYDQVLVERVGDPVIGGPEVYLEPERENVRAGHLTTLALTAGGLWAASYLTRADDYTVGDAYALRSAAALGAQAMLPVAELTAGEENRGKRYAGAAVLGGVAGTAVGSRFLRGRSISSGEGLILNAGQVAGTLGALGVTWLLVPDAGDNPLLFSLASAVGGGAGLALTWTALAPGDDEVAVRSGASPTLAGSDIAPGRPPGARNVRREGLRTELSPVGLLAGLLAPDGTGTDASRSALPVLTLRF